MRPLLPVLSVCVGLALCLSPACLNNPNNRQGGGPPPDAGGSDCSQLDLNGYWIDTGDGQNQVQITQTGADLTAVYTDPPFFVCDLGDASGTVQTTQTDFTGTIAGCTLVAQIKVCHFGCSVARGCGIQDADATATLDPANPDHIEGTWHDPASGADVPFTLHRLPCRRKPADDYVPAATPNSGLDFVRFDSPDGNTAAYSAPAPPGSAPVTLVAGVSGTVADILPAENGLGPALFVSLANGNQIFYDLSGPASVALVVLGDPVDPSTPIATLARDDATGSFAFQVSGLTADAAAPNTSPDCIEQSPGP